MNIPGPAVAEQVSKNLGESQAEKQRDNWKWDAVCAMRAVTETRGGLRGVTWAQEALVPPFMHACLHAYFYSILYLSGE